MKGGVMITATLLTVAGSSSAQMSQRNVEQLQARLRELAIAAADGTMFSVDQDGSGSIDRREAAAAPGVFETPKGLADPRLWALMDRDRNGRITKGEMRAGSLAIHDRVAAGRKPF